MLLSGGFFFFFLREPAVKPRRTVASEVLPTYPVRKHTQLGKECLVLLVEQQHRLSFLGAWGPSLFCALLHQGDQASSLPTLVGLGIQHHHKVNEVRLSLTLGLQMAVLHLSIWRALDGRSRASKTWVSLCECVCICSCVGVCTCISRCLCVHMCSEAKGQCRVSSFVDLHLTLLTRGLKRGRTWCSLI